MVGGKLIYQLGGIEGAGSKLKVAFQGEEAIDGLAAGYGVQIATAGQGHQAVGEQFQVSGELTFGFAEALGEALDFTHGGGVEGKYAIRLPQPGLLNNDGFGLIVTWCGHFFLRQTEDPVSTLVNLL